MLLLQNSVKKMGKRQSPRSLAQSAGWLRPGWGFGLSDGIYAEMLGGAV
jgi:hypothetical protein